MNKILLLLSVLVLASCSNSLDVPLDPELNLYFGNDSNQNVMLTSKDKEYVALNDWLSEHKSDWYSTSGHYPGGMYMKSGVYGIQITKTHVVLYSTTSTQPKAIYIQKIGRDELMELRDIGKQAQK